MLYIGWILITIGLLIIICGIIALIRFPDFYTKIHAASLIECSGLPVCLIGLSLQQSYINSIKLLIIVLLIFILNPVSTHALGRASLLYKFNKEGRIK